MSTKLICLIVSILMLGLTGSVSADLVGHWMLDDGSGTTVSDSSGNGNDGTIEGDPTWITGVNGAALEFHGLGAAGGGGDYIDCGNDASLDITGPISIALWIRPGADDAEGNGTETAPMAKADSGASPSWSYQVRYGWGSSEPYMAFTFNTSPRAWAYVGENLERDEWCHIACSHDGVTLKCYLDGEETASTPMGAITSSPTSVLIGSDGWGCDWIGAIDDVRIYDHALTESEILGTMVGQVWPYAYGPNPEDGALHADTWVTLSWKPGGLAVSHNIYIGDNFEDVNNGVDETFRGNQDGVFIVAGFPGYPYPDGLVPGTTYYWRIDEVNDSEPNSPWKGDVWSFMVPPKTAYYPDPINGAELVPENVTLTWTSGFGAKLHTVYFGDDFDTVNDAAGGAPMGVASYTPGALELAKTYYWRIDEFDGAGTYKGNVWSFTTEGSVSGPNPSNGAVDVKPTAVLRWDAGAVAASHEVYFGSVADAVKNATKASPEYKGAKALGEESYDPGKLALTTTYYWRIDEVNGVNPDSPWAGNVWSFTTGDFFVIDDFEDYDAGDNQIWCAWHDGLGYGTPGTADFFAGNGTGAAVGDENTPSYTEETIVHGGGKSMPVAYDNNKQGYSKNSEVDLTLSMIRNWTEEGVTELSLWFYGDSANSVEPLYVAVSNSAGTPAVVVHDDPIAATIGAWTQWIIPLQAFADQGINLSNVDKIAIGLGTKGNMTVPGGSGKMYFDDIRLNRP